MTRLVVSTSAPTGREERIWRAVARLAESPPPVDEARRRPATPGLAESLVFEFDEAYTVFVEGFERLPSEAQLIALQAVDSRVSEMVRAREAALWTEGARREDPRWAELRRLAADVLDVFGWPNVDAAAIGGRA